jgi:hypothetical protein
MLSTSEIERLLRNQKETQDFAAKLFSCGSTSASPIARFMKNMAWHRRGGACVRPILLILLDNFDLAWACPSPCPCRNVRWQASRHCSCAAYWRRALESPRCVVLANAFAANLRPIIRISRPRPFADGADRPAQPWPFPPFPLAPLSVGASAASSPSICPAASSTASSGSSSSFLKMISRTILRRGAFPGSRCSSCCTGSNRNWG